MPTYANDTHDPFYRDIAPYSIRADLSLGGNTFEGLLMAFYHDGPHFRFYHSSDAAIFDMSLSPMLDGGPRQTLENGGIVIGDEDWDALLKKLSFLDTESRSE